MKNFAKFLGLIALVAVIGFSFVSCSSGGGGDGERPDNGPTPGGGGKATFRIKNEYANTINYVCIILHDSVEEKDRNAILTVEDANIAPNAEKSFSFTVNYDPGRYKCKLVVGTDSSNTDYMSWKTMRAGDTQRVVIDSSGQPKLLD